MTISRRQALLIRPFFCSLLLFLLAAPLSAGGEPCDFRCSPCLVKLVEHLQNKGWVGIEFDEIRFNNQIGHILAGQLGTLRRHWRPIAVVGLINSALPFLLFMILFKIAFGIGPGESGILPMLAALAASQGFAAIQWSATTPSMRPREFDTSARRGLAAEGPRAGGQAHLS